MIENQYIDLQLNDPKFCLPFNEVKLKFQIPDFRRGANMCRGTVSA